MIPGWASSKAQVHSLWVSALFGRSAWRSPAEVLGGVPALIVRGLPIASSKATWVAPGWAVVTYDVPASAVFRPRAVETRIEPKRRRWRCDRMERQPACALGARVPAFGYGRRDHRRHALARSGHAAESDALTGGFSTWKRRLSELRRSRGPASVSRRMTIGGQRGTIVDGSIAWPTPGVLDHTIHAPLLSALGIIDAVALLGGGLVVGQWATGTRATAHPAPSVGEAADETTRGR